MRWQTKQGGTEVLAAKVGEADTAATREEDSLTRHKDIYPWELGKGVEVEGRGVEPVEI